MPDTYLDLPDAFKKIIGILAEVPEDFDPDATSEGWTKLDKDQKRDNRRILHFQVGGQAISVLKFIFALVTYSMNRFTVTKDLFDHIFKIGGLFKTIVKSFDYLNGTVMTINQKTKLRPSSSDTWNIIAEYLDMDNRFKEALRDWTSAYFEDLFIPFMTAGGMPTSNAPNNTDRNQSKLRQECLQRDGHITVVGGILNRFLPKHTMKSKPDEYNDKDSLEICHIIPFSTAGNSNFLKVISNFTGGLINDQTFTNQTLNDTSNALMLNRQMHSSFNRFEWSIEFKSKSKFNYQYLFRKFGDEQPLFLKNMEDGQEVYFGDFDSSISLPSELFFNVYTALAKVLHASSAVESLYLIVRDEEELRQSQRR